MDNSRCQKLEGDFNSNIPPVGELQQRSRTYSWVLMYWWLMPLVSDQLESTERFTITLAKVASDYTFEFDLGQDCNCCSLSTNEPKLYNQFFVFQPRVQPVQWWVSVIRSGFTVCLYKNWRWQHWLVLPFCRCGKLFQWQWSLCISVVTEINLNPPFHTTTVSALVSVKSMVGIVSCCKP